MSKLQYARAIFSIFLGVSASKLFAELPSTPLSSNRAVTQQLKALYEPHPFTFFCNLPFNQKGFANFKGEYSMNLDRIQWIPIVAKPQLAAHLLCYREKICVSPKGERFGGLRCCQERDTLYQQMTRDLHNLVPELSFFKQQRRHYRFGIIEDLPVAGCHFIVDQKNKVVEPAPQIRGTIAWAYLYMRDTYHIPLSATDSERFMAWHQQYPADEWERLRNEKIKQIQGNSNWYI